MTIVQDVENQSRTEWLAPSPFPTDAQAVLEGMLDACCAIGRNWQLLYVNAAAERMWGLRREDILGRHLLDVFPVLAGSDVHAITQRAMAEVKPLRSEATSPVLGIPVEIKIGPNSWGLLVHVRDISERRQMERALRDRDDLLTLAEQTAGVGVWEIDLATDMVEGTAQYLRIMGLPPTGEPVPMQRVRALRYPADRQRIAEGFRAMMADGSDSFEVEYRIRRIDGVTRWIFGRGRVIRDAAGRPVRYSGIDVDVTDRKQSEAALGASVARFRRVFEQSPLGKATAGTDMRLREVNPALCQMLGYTAQERFMRAWQANRHCRAKARLTVEAMGFAVEVADRARKALDRLAEDHGFDLLLTDVVMPEGMTGLDLAQQVTSRFPDLPIILMSGYNDVVARSSPGFQVLHKPIPYGELFRSICACLDGGPDGRAELPTLSKQSS